MGLLTRGLLRVFEEVAEQVEQELYNEDAVTAELMDLYQKLEAGALSDEEFARHEVECVQRLEAIAEHKKRRAGRGSR